MTAKERVLEKYLTAKLYKILDSCAVYREISDNHSSVIMSIGCKAYKSAKIAWYNAEKSMKNNLK